MSAMMLLSYLWLPKSQRYEPPPEEIVDEATRVAAVDDDLTDGEVKSLTLGAHFAYGAAMGAAYELLAHRRSPPPLASGAAFGLAVWTGSYLGWLPAFRSRARASQQSAARNAMMIAAHLVWGGATGLLCDRLRSRSRHVIG